MPRCPIRLDRRERRREDVRPDAGQPLDLHRLVEVERADVGIDAVELLRSDHIVVCHRQRILFEHAADLAEVAEGTAHADQLCVGQDLGHPLQFGELLFDIVLDELGALLRSAAVLLGKLGQHDRAERQRDVLQQIFAVVVDELSAAAADVHDQTARDVHRVDHALIDQLRLFVLVEHAQLYAGGREHVVEEAALIFGAPDRGGRVRIDLLHLVGVAETAEHFERLDGLRHARRL